MLARGWINSPDVIGLLQPALDVHGTHTMDDIAREVDAGTMQLWVGDGAALVTEEYNSPCKKNLHIALGGGELNAVLLLADEVIETARNYNYSGVSICGRLGWKRVLEKRGWRATALHMELKK